MIFFITSIMVVFLVMAAAGCIAAAFWVYMASHIGPMGAFLATAGGFLFLALIVLALTKGSIKKKPHLFPLRSSEAMMGQATKLMSDHKGAIILTALLLGMLAGRRKRGL